MANVPKKWRDLFELLPGYDPIATAGDCTFDVSAAEKACAFFPENLTFVEGRGVAGKPFELQPWQQALIGCVFGWKRPDGYRRYREVLQYIPRKNGKTSMLAGLVNLIGFCDFEPGGQIYSAAGTRDQASIIHGHTKNMLLANPELAGATKIFESMKSVKYPLETIYRALSSDANSAHGLNPSAAIVDELHVQKNRDMVDGLKTGMGNRLQPLFWHITTADFFRESICNEKYDYGCKVRDGIIEDQEFLPCIFEASNDDDWESPEVWRKANPNLGVSVQEEFLRRECERAKNTPTYLNTFKRLYLNIRTLSDVAWIPIEKWDACGESFDPSILDGRECFAGLDLSTTTDVSAFVLVFPPLEEEGEVYVLPFFWIPGERAEHREKTDRVPYITWARQDLIKMTDGNVVDYRVIRKEINDLGKRFNIKEIAADRWNATQLIQDLQDDGFEVIQYGQGFRDMTAPTKDLEALCVSGRLRHGGNKPLRWMASNVMVETDAAGNLKPSKKKSTERIDGIVALIMGLGRMNMTEGTPTVSQMMGFF